jgi:N-acyl-D-aspartate/D-glutamate deacylase
MDAAQPEPILIRGGTVVDGTGATPLRADVRASGGSIAEVARELVPARGERVVDAGGCFVSPGFIESHTHFDGAAWWSPGLDPLPGYGVTSAIMGNCGFSLAPAPADPAARRELVQIFSFFEDIPEPPFLAALPWDWRLWSEYRRSAERAVRPRANLAAFVGHIALRLAVLGLDAWQRAATPAEITQMAALLEDGLAAGALGLSSNLNDYDGSDRPVPSLRADDAELRALFEVVARHPGATFQVIVDVFRNMDGAESVERIARLSRDLPLRVQWGGVPTSLFQKKVQGRLAELHERLGAEGRDFWTAFSHVPTTVTISLNQSLIFAQNHDYAWHEVVTAPGETAKLALLRDPAWRARARHSWDHEVLEHSLFARSKPRHLRLQNSDNGAGPIGITLGEYADRLGLHPSDAMAEWLVANGLQSTVSVPPFPKDEAMVLRLLRDPRAVGNVSDAGAHGQMMCGGGENALLLCEYVRERGALSIEEAVHVQTGRLAEHFGLRDRGRIAPGLRADLTVFALEEIQRRELCKAQDVPDGNGGTTWRWTRPPAPVRLTLVEGVPTFEHGRTTGASPGRWLRPGGARR